MNTLKPPTSQRTFGSNWVELDYLCRKIHYWLYVRKEKSRALRFLHRLKRVLAEIGNDEFAIVRQEGLAQFHELKGDLGSAIFHREEEIRLTELLHKDVQTHKYDAETKAYMLQRRANKDLTKRHEILDSLRTRQLNNGSPKARLQTHQRARA
jgi:hypothetical protein